MVFTMLEAVTKWISPSRALNSPQVVVIEGSDPQHSFNLGSMIAKVLQKPYLDLRQMKPQAPDSGPLAFVVSKTKSQLGLRDRRDRGACVLIVDDLIQMIEEAGVSSQSPIQFQCLRLAMLKLANHRKASRSTKRR
jgi:hypothetical protein